VICPERVKTNRIQSSFLCLCNETMYWKISAWSKLEKTIASGRRYRWGKSPIINLILSFYEINSSITIDDVHSKILTWNLAQSTSDLVLQTVFLFRIALLLIITLANPTYSEHMMYAADLAGCKAFYQRCRRLDYKSWKERNAFCRPAIVIFIFRAMVYIHK